MHSWLLRPGGPTQWLPWLPEPRSAGTSVLKARRADTITIPQMSLSSREPLHCRPIRAWSSHTVGPLGLGNQQGTWRPGDCVAPADTLSANSGLRSHTFGPFGPEETTVGPFGPYFMAETL